MDREFEAHFTAKDTQENAVAEGREMCSIEITVPLPNSYSNFIIDASFARCENLIEGRLSFCGMNPELERLLELEEEEKRAAERQQQSNDVSNPSMAKFYYANNEQAGAAPAMEQKFSKFEKVEHKNHSNNNNRPQKRLQEGGAEYTDGGKEKRTKFIEPEDRDNDDGDDVTMIDV